MKSEEIVFNGITFRRYPESKRRPDRVYYTCNSRYYKQGIRRLHQEIWKSVNGEIPKGYVIHHKDENPLNNAIENLACVPLGKHRSNHAKEWASNPEVKKQMSERAKKNVHKLIEWYETDEGKARRKESAKYLRTVKHKHVCIQCGKEYETYYIKGSFCGRNCLSQNRRESGIDNETRICPMCGKEFVVNKYAIKKTCSKKCGGLFRRGKSHNRIGSLTITKNKVL